MSRFDFIKNKDTNLYKLCLETESRANDDLDIFMLKCRRALECIVTIAGCKGNNLYQKVDDINNNLNISRDMKHKIFVLKDICNENIHFEDEMQGEKVDAYMVLDQLNEICHWLVDAIIDKQVQDVITDSVKVLEQKQKELIEAFKKNDIESVSRISDEIKQLSEQQGKTINNIKGENVENTKIVANLTALEVQRRFQRIKIAAEQGDAEAQKYLADKYRNDKDHQGKTIYFEQALYWSKKAAEQGDAASQDYIARNERAKKNLENAFYWFKKAAEQGNAASQYRLGLSYYKGEGCEKNLENAFYWFKKSAEQGYMAAIGRTSICYYMGNGCEEDWEQAFYWANKAITDEAPGSYWFLGMCYHNGVGCDIDIKKASYWYKKAIEKGYQRAKESLIEIENELKINANIDFYVDFSVRGEFIIKDKCFNLNNECQIKESSPNYIDLIANGVLQGEKDFYYQGLGSLKIAKLMSKVMIYSEDEEIARISYGQNMDEDKYGCRIMAFDTFMAYNQMLQNFLLGLAIQIPCQIQRNKKCESEEELFNELRIKLNI